jgi:hypothetical protein
MTIRTGFQSLLWHIPFGADIDYALFWKSARRLPDRYSLSRLTDVGEACASAARHSSRSAPSGKHVFIFCVHHYWIEHTAIMGLALAGQGHQVTLAYLPYADWFTPVGHFSMRRRELYTQDVLSPARDLMEVVPLTAGFSGKPIPEELRQEVEHISCMDVQYTLQAEEVDRKSPLYRLRMQRNMAAARSALADLAKKRPDVVILPSGSILEFGVVYRVASFLGIPTTTYEFSEKSDSLWLAQNAQIMRHETDALWNARRDLPLTKQQHARLSDYLAARQVSQRSSSFAQLLQEAPRQGKIIRSALGLDIRPVVLLTTNVLGDALTLDRQLFSQSMTEWFLRTVRYFLARSDIQVIIRIHPGESTVKGPSISRFIEQEFPQLPEHIHLIQAREKINTYDLMDIADLGLVYTTTAGLEMATRGIPVIPGGRTHYRGRGFTLDVDSWEQYFATLDRILPDLPAHRLTSEQLDLAWNYAYRFFLEFARPYPWHLYTMTGDLARHPMQAVLSDEGMHRYRKTFDYLVGEPLDWKNIES